LEDAQWRETTAMLAPCLFDEGGGVRVDRLAEHILNTAQAPDTNQLEHQARLAGLVGRILVPMDTYGYKARADIAERYRGLLNSVLPLFEEAKASVEVSAEARVAAAEALGRAGDPRLESNRFITVPNTQVALGRYPVTVQDYLPFVEAGGYENSEWWSPLGWQTRHDNGWREPDKWAEQLQHQTRPVIYVSYFEAEAFCGWLTVELGRRCWLPDGDEWSAIAERGRAQFPWGDDEPTDQHANFRHRHGGCTPVGCFPLGDGSFGHGDVAGNVWEWTAEVHEPTDDETKAWGKEIIWFKLRGGGWGHPAEDLASAIRIRSRAEDRYSGVGFRVASALDD
ncbi:MAG: SUMF1/EgtB/PvdO family nonheme iron enzyme, partial [Pseudomonadota bacterium]